MLAILAAVLAFVTIGGLGWVFVGEDNSSDKAIKRAEGFTSGGNQTARAKAAKAEASTPEARRKVIELQLKEAERRERKARMTMKAKLKHAGMSLSIRTFWIISGCLAAVAFLVPLFLGLNVLVALGIAVVVGLGFPRWVVGFIGKSRLKKFSMEFANAVDIIVRGIQSGLPVHDCFKIIARESPSPVGPEFKILVEGLGVGLTLGQALDKMYDRVPTPELRFFSIVIAIQQKTGGNLGEALSNLTTVLRARRMMGEKIKALSSEAIASAGIIGSLPPVIMILVGLTSPAYMGLMFTDFRGHVMLLGAGMWMGLGILVMKQMISFKF
ncbi:type II secretion system F family protein [Brevundimonas subvibrioides]|uniref:type II secretion system F family protein n=1 Tax=Brevundimonas subvibrioides TaxID=74313 RepID=UPI0022B4C618|nr:type II secretion system F family protein [Brevundimonas subvibrioides]